MYVVILVGVGGGQLISRVCYLRKRAVRHSQTGSVLLTDGEVPYLLRRLA